MVKVVAVVVLALVCCSSPSHQLYPTYSTNTEAPVCIPPNEASCSFVDTLCGWSSGPGLSSWIKTEKSVMYLNLTHRGAQQSQSYSSAEVNLKSPLLCLPESDPYDVYGTAVELCVAFKFKMTGSISNGVRLTTSVCTEREPCEEHFRHVWEGDGAWRIETFTIKAPTIASSFLIVFGGSHTPRVSEDSAIFLDEIFVVVAPKACPSPRTTKTTDGAAYPMLTTLNPAPGDGAAGAAVAEGGLTVGLVLAIVLPVCAFVVLLFVILVVVIVRMRSHQLYDRPAPRSAWEVQHYAHFVGGNGARPSSPDQRPPIPLPRSQEERESQVYAEINDGPGSIGIHIARQTAGLSQHSYLELLDQPRNAIAKDSK